MSALNPIFLILFLVAAGLQYNDDDRWLWIAFYAAAALLCLLAQRRALPPTVGLVAGLGTALWSATIASRVFGKQSWLDSMEGREALGTAIVALWMIALGLWARRRARHWLTG